MHEILELLAPRPGDVLADCTAGRGGHASEIGTRLGATGTVVLSDLDAGNLHFAEARVRALAEAPTVIAVHGSFERMPQSLRTAGVQANMLLADLGFASNQMDDPARGLGFGQPGP
ncbi:MAG: 16S rRNA (cytosine(1402)-N(4))-methyltransferase, partial [Planctomycetes bacterium]|nr:16S rRNA (cytosine(1402)-N(4))-methyltransferase [Planctomycetota bacterium]